MPFELSRRATRPVQNLLGDPRPFRFRDAPRKLLAIGHRDVTGPRPIQTAPPVGFRYLRQPPLGPSKAVATVRSNPHALLEQAFPDEALDVASTRRHMDRTDHASASQTRADPASESLRDSASRLRLPPAPPLPHDALRGRSADDALNFVRSSSPPVSVRPRAKSHDDGGPARQTPSRAAKPVDLKGPRGVGRIGATGSADDRPQVAPAPMNLTQATTHPPADRHAPDTHPAHRAQRQTDVADEHMAPVAEPSDMEPAPTAEQLAATWKLLERMGVSVPEQHRPLSETMPLPSSPPVSPSKPANATSGVLPHRSAVQPGPDTTHPSVVSTIGHNAVKRAPPQRSSNSEPPLEARVVRQRPPRTSRSPDFGSTGRMQRLWPVR